MSLYKRKDSPYWWVKVAVTGRPAVQASTGTTDKAGAQEYHDRLKTRLWEETRLGHKPRRSWQESALRWLQETDHKATHRDDIAKLRWLDVFLGALMLDQINLDVIDRIRAAKLKEASKATTNRYLALVRSILIRARDDREWIDKVSKIKLYKESAGRERALSPAQAQGLLDELPAHQRDVVLFALFTGLRQGNVLGLEWSQVNADLRHAYVPPGKSKSRRAIAVPLNDRALEVLSRQVGKHPVRVFTYAGQPLKQANTKAWHAALKRAGIEDFRWHDLRHTWATWHRQAGTPTHELQRLGGWVTGAMVERYAHVAPDQLAGSASRLDRLAVGYDLATVAKEKGASLS